MKKQLLTFVALVALSGAAFAQTSTSTTVSTSSDGTTSVSTTDGSGTITEFVPGTSLIVRTTSDAEPIRYRVAKDVVYSDGTVNIDPTTIRVGTPVRYVYEKDGDEMVVKKVIVTKTTTTKTED